MEGCLHVNTTQGDFDTRARAKLGKLKDSRGSQQRDDKVWVEGKGRKVEICETKHAHPTQFNDANRDSFDEWIDIGYVSAAKSISMTLRKNSRVNPKGIENKEPPWHAECFNQRAEQHQD
jgi:hypothetical protein